MKKKLIYFILSVSAVSIVSLFQGCYYDVEEELYPNTNVCDTSMVTYSSNIKTVLDLECNSCHSQLVAQGGIVLDNYQDVKDLADGGNLLGSIRHDSGFSPMPQGAAKLNNCTILTIEKWISEGALNN